MDYIRAVDDVPARPEFRYVERPRAAARPASRRWTSSSTTRTRATASTSRARWRCCCGWAASRRAWRPASRPGGYSERHKAWIVRDTDAHAWVEVVVRRVRLGHARPDAGRDARPLAGRRAGRAAVRARRSSPDRGTGADDARQRDRRPSPASAPSCRSAASDTDGSGADDGGSARAGCAGSGSACSSRAALLALLLFLRRPRGKTPMDRAIAEVEDAMRRVGRPVTTGHDAAPAREPPRLALAGGRGVPARAGLGPLRAGLGPAVTRGPARVAARAGSGTRVRRAAAGLVGDAAAVRAAAAARARVRDRDERSRLAGERQH